MFGLRCSIWDFLEKWVTSLWPSDDPPLLTPDFDSHSGDFPGIVLSYSMLYLWCFPIALTFISCTVCGSVSCLCSSISHFSFFFNSPFPLILFCWPLLFPSDTVAVLRCGETRRLPGDMEDIRAYRWLRAPRQLWKLQPGKLQKAGKQSGVCFTQTHSRSYSAALRSHKHGLRPRRKQRTTGCFVLLSLS